MPAHPAGVDHTYDDCGEIDVQTSKILVEETVDVVSIEVSIVANVVIVTNDVPPEFVEIDFADGLSDPPALQDREEDDSSGDDSSIVISFASFEAEEKLSSNNHTIDSSLSIQSSISGKKWRRWKQRCFQRRRRSRSCDREFIYKTKSRTAKHKTRRFLGKVYSDTTGEEQPGLTL